MKRWLMTMCFAALAVSGALAQGKKNVPLPAKPAENGPSLEVTMKFIQDKLNDIGAVSFMTFGKQTTDDKTFSHRWTFELSDVHANPADCSIQYHEKLNLDGNSQSSDGKPNEVTISVPLAAMEDVHLQPFEQFETRDLASQGHPELIVTSTQPQTFALMANPRVKLNFWLIWAAVYFQDATLADRVARALTHAVELCGGGSTPEPF